MHDHYYCTIKIKRIILLIIIIYSNLEKNVPKLNKKLVLFQNVKNENKNKLIKWFVNFTLQHLKLMQMKDNFRNIMLN